MIGVIYREPLSSTSILLLHLRKIFLDFTGFSVAVEEAAKAGKF